MKNFDCIVIGAGPAGASAAIYVLRSNRSVAVIDSGATALKRAYKIENYYGVSSVSGDELYRNGRMQIEALGGELVDAQALAVSYNGEYVVETTNGDYSAPSLIIATGSGNKEKKINGQTEFEGKGVSRCAVCDGFFFKGKPVCVVGAGDYALHEAQVLRDICSSVTVLTDGEETKISDFSVITEKISAIKGDVRVRSVEFESGKTIDVNAVFIANSQPTASDFALRMGLMLENGNLVTDGNMSTALSGVFAAGDCAASPKQIATAVYTGMKAGLSAVAYLKQRKGNGM